MKVKGVTFGRNTGKINNDSKKARIIKSLLIGLGLSLFITFLIVLIPNVLLDFILIPFDFRFIVSVFVGLFVIYFGITLIVMSVKWKTWIKVLVSFLAGMIGTILMVSGMYLTTTLSFFGGTSVQDYNSLTYSVVVNDDSGINRIVDLSGKKIEFLRDDGVTNAMNK